MTAQIRIGTDVKSKEIESAYVEAPFDKAKTALENSGYRIISLAENAQLRMQEGVDSPVSQTGNYVREGVLYVPRKGIFLVRNSPIMENAQEATECHRTGKEFYLTPEQVEQSLADSVKLTDWSIPIYRFGYDKVANFAFGKDAQAYGEFLRNSKYKIQKIPVWLVDVSKKPFARQMWFCRLDVYGRSGLDGDSGGLLYGNRVRGIKNISDLVKQGEN